MAAKTSAGILLWRRSGKSIECLLAHPGGPFWAKKDDGAWSLPKGEFDAGEESPIAAARREFAEELGHPAPDDTPVVDLDTITQKAGKVVYGFAIEGDFDPEMLNSNTFEMPWPPKSGRMQAFPEVDRVAWFEPDAATEKLLEAQRPFVDRLVTGLDGPQ